MTSEHCFKFEVGQKPLASSKGLLSVMSLLVCIMPSSGEASWLQSPVAAGQLCHKTFVQLELAPRHPSV